MDIKTATASAIVLVAVWEVAKAYRETAPSLIDLREHGTNDTAQRQQLLDATMTVGGITVIASGAIWAMSGSPIPALLIIASFLWLTLYYHLVQKGPVTNEL